MKFCPRCNQYFDDNTGFCGNCGGPLGVMPPQPPQFSQQPPQQGMNPQ